jgi:hypothetical protein
MTDYKALCAELCGIFEKYDDESNLAGIYWDMETDGNDVLDRTRTAIAQPEPEGPTVMEIIELANEIEAAELGQVDLVRAALARWGNL